MVGIVTVLASGGGEVEVGMERGGLGAESEEGEGGVVREDTEVWDRSLEVEARELGCGEGRGRRGGGR